MTYNSLEKKPGLELILGGRVRLKQRFIELIDLATQLIEELAHQVKTFEVKPEPQHKKAIVINTRLPVANGDEWQKYAKKLLIIRGKGINYPLAMLRSLTSVRGNALAVEIESDPNFPNSEIEKRTTTLRKIIEHLTSYEWKTQGEAIIEYKKILNEVKELKQF